MANTQADFAEALLKRLGIHPTNANLKAVVGWENAEGGHWHNQARFNPLNTTQNMPGAGNTGSQGNIKVYKNWHQGVEATAKTLENGRYQPILQALKGNNPSAVANAIGRTPWGTGGGLVQRTIAAAPSSFSGVTGSLSGGSAAPSGSAAPTTTRVPGQTITTQIPTVDQAGFEQARKLAIVGGLIARRNPNSFLLRSGLLSTQEPTLSNFVGSKTVKDVIPGATVRAPATAQASFSTPAGQSGTANFEGKKVAAWIAPALKYARAHGWNGTVESGFRSFADQTRIYNSGVRPAAKPGTSNHEGADFPRGAVDVDRASAPQLAAILHRSPYGKRLKWAGSKDPVHFSHPHNGSY